MVPLIMATLVAVDANLLWILSNITTDEILLNFGESMAAPGDYKSLDRIINITHTAIQPISSTVRTPITFIKEDGFGVAKLGVTSPYLLEASASYGISKKSGEEAILLQYYASADMVQKPHDWFGINQISRNMLEVKESKP